MQVVILAAGQSSRFFPYNNKHKCLVKIAGEPLIVHTIRSVKRAGITNIIFVTGDNNDFRGVLGNGKKLGVNIKYVVQKEPSGAGQALLLAAGFIGSSDFFLVNSNHVEFDALKKIIDEKRKINRDVILLAKKSSGKHFGEISVEGDRVLQVIEKPKSNKGLSGFRIIGVYFLNQEFIEVLKKIKPEHYSLEKALNVYAKTGKVRLAEVDMEVLTLKYPWDTLGVKNFVLGKIRRNISKKATIAKSANIIGNVFIGEGAIVSENAVIKGPCYIGKNVFIGSNTLIRNNSDIEDRAKIGAYMEIKNALIGEGSSTHSGFAGDSLIGSNTKIGAIFGTANVRLDRENVKATVNSKKIDTNLRSLGTIVGDNVVVGERVSTMPGVIIGNNVVIGPSTTVMKNVPSDSTFYTKFSEVILKKKPVRNTKTK